MKITLVGVRNGKPVIHWPSVVVMSAIVIAATSTGAVLGCFLLGRSFFLLPQTLAMSVPMLLVGVVGINVKRGLQTPPSQLPPLS
jgi:hypothetical protein